MDRIKLTFVGFTIITTLLFSYIALTYGELKKINNYNQIVRQIGHQTIEMRDQIIRSSLHGLSETKALNRDLVELEYELQRLPPLAPIHSLLFQDLPTNSLLSTFRHSALEVTQSLDQYINLQTQKTSAFQSFESRIRADKSTAVDALSLEQIMAQLSVPRSPTSGSDVQELANSFIRISGQSEQVLSGLLAHDRMAFLEQTEHDLALIANSLNGKISNTLLTFTVLSIAVIAIFFAQKLTTLRRDNEGYQRETEAAEKANLAKSNFLATMSHELRTPMNGVLGIAQIIKDESRELDTKKQAQIIIDSGQHLTTILNDILDFSKVEQGKLELEVQPFLVTDVMSSMEKTLGPQAKSKGLQFVINNDIPHNIELHGDPARTRQILFNLVGNAIKFTSSGKIEIHCQLDKEMTPPHVCLSVTDSGIGIEQDKLASIFTPFEQAELSTTRKFGGTGLGLSIVKRLIELMNGDISVTSQPSVGTRFSARIPFTLKEIENVKTESNPLQEGDILDNFTVLLVEDNRINALVAEKFCESMNLRVDHAHDGVEAISKLEHTSYDLIIMDNHMPNMNGLDTIEHIRNKMKLNTVVFACTADVFKEAHDEFLRRGANFILTKPMQKSSLKKALHQFSNDFTVNRRHIEMLGSLPQESGYNISILTRYPADTLPLTEEEISQSPLFDQLDLHGVDKIELLQVLVIDLDAKADSLIELYSNTQASTTTTEMHAILHSLKGVALEYSMAEVISLTKQAEDMARNGKVPDIDLLQKLVNRLIVNCHEARRIISRLSGQQKTG
ncbi:ATP-binding protein [Vibrio ostreicida]|uniref:histidine kinase n=1 Tax=Vibrio ostreicida TaxID=526588 RepID=A0ABT8BSY4_9VIBR|nr:ATP-binding protein [Vibrio ostreicida]MDN3609778.1 ATP-binding protein [Vibrio ostreicida]NPD09394.1 response regulator [Vibrio ostreicida]